jgi:hypothetical protein
MKNTIKRVLAQYADKQINLGSESAREMIAEKIADEVGVEIARIFAKGVEEAFADERVEPELVLPSE